jgi:hypothetical protein
VVQDARGSEAFTLGREEIGDYRPGGVFWSQTAALRLKAWLVGHGWREIDG